MTMHKIVPVLAILLIAGLLVAGCAKPPEEPAPTPPGPSAVKPPPTPPGPEGAKAIPAPQMPEKVVYFCTMHPDQISDKPGKCPKCGMDLVEGVYQCPMHPGEVSDKPGKCKVCGMDLKLVPKAEAQKALEGKAPAGAKGETAEHTH